MNILKRKHLFLALLLVIILALATAFTIIHRQSNSGAVLQSGIKGTVVVDGGCPVIREDSPCPSKPLAAGISITDTNAKTVATTKSDASGHFQVSLAPGTYTANATNINGALHPIAQPVQVTVKAGVFTDVMISFDSGIR